MDVSSLIGVMDATFHTDGQTPLTSERLKMINTGKQMDVANCLMKDAGKQSGPGPLEESTAERTPFTSSADTFNCGRHKL